jgi:hypothetical protein
VVQTDLRQRDHEHDWLALAVLGRLHLRCGHHTHQPIRIQRNLRLLAPSSKSTASNTQNRSSIPNRMGGHRCTKPKNLRRSSHRPSCSRHGPSCNLSPFFSPTISVSCISSSRISLPYGHHPITHTVNPSQPADCTTSHWSQGNIRVTNRIPHHRPNLAKENDKTSRATK